MKLDEQAIQGLLEEARPGVVAILQKSMLEQIDFTTRQTVAKIVEAEVEAWCKDNVVPEVLKALAESKEGIIAGARSFAATTTQTLMERMSEQIAKNLSESWKLKKVMEALVQ